MKSIQKYMEDLTDMQNHVLPYLQSFCSLEEKGVKERREQQIAEKNEEQSRLCREQAPKQMQQLRMQGKQKESQWHSRSRQW